MNRERPRHRNMLLFALLLLATQAWGQILPQSQRDLQRRAAKELWPAAVQLRVSADTPLADRPPFRVRVWACRDYQDQTVNWQPRFRGLVRRVNEQLRRWPGVQLEVVELRTWARTSMAEPLPQLLQALEAQDRGEDVDWVIGLASAVSTVPTSIHTLGAAQPLSKHFVLRNLSSLEELALVRESLDQIDESERQNLLAVRRAHKELVVFLHEWAHTLGALHARHGSLIMNPEYHRDQARLDDGNSRLIEAALRRWADEAEHPRLWQAQQRLLRDAPDPEWEPHETAAHLSYLEVLRSSGARRSIPAPVPGQSRGPAEATAAAVGAVAACAQAAAGKEPSLASVVALCRPAREQAPADPGPALALGKAYADAGQLQEALAEGQEAAARLTRHPVAAGWSALAALFRRARAPSLALHAAQQAGGETARSFAAWHQGLRQRFALPTDAAQRGLEPQREPELLGTMESAQVAIEQRRGRLVEQLITQVERDFPRLAAGPLLRCEWALQQRRLPAAAAACDRALQIHEETGAALLLRGMVAVAAGQREEAWRRLQQALALMPEAEEGWQALVGLLRPGDAAGLSALREDYQRRLGRPPRF